MAKATPTMRRLHQLAPSAYASPDPKTRSSRPLSASIAEGQEPNAAPVRLASSMRRPDRRQSIYGNYEKKKLETNWHILGASDREKVWEQFPSLNFSGGSLFCCSLFRNPGSRKCRFLKSINLGSRKCRPLDAVFRLLKSIKSRIEKFNSSSICCGK